ncbi:MAG: hypothetical protein KAS66_14055 [Candidatus Omnitrophica bacterium]|nr:hypothetical protein [Candidatus Omnitrophota bacterium]
MSELEDQISILRSKVETDEAKISELKSGLWQNKKDLKKLEDALAIVLGTEKKEKPDDTAPPGLNSII